MNLSTAKHQSCPSLQDPPRDQGIWHISQVVFWLEFVCFLICMTWHYTYHTTVSFLNSQQQRQLLEIVTWIAVFNIFFLCGYNRRQLLEISFLLLLLLLSRYNSQFDDGYLLYSMAIALSCRRIQPHELLRRVFWLYLLIFSSVLFLYRFGLLSPMHSKEERYRMNLGFSHYNTLGMVIVCIVILWILLRYEKTRWYDYLVWLGAAFFVWEVPNSRTATLCILLLLTGVFLSKNCKMFEKHLFRILAISVFPVMAGLSYISAALYSPDNPVLFFLNQLFSYRIRFGNDYLNKYQITLFGQKIRRINPDTAAKRGISPEILDNGYLRILLQLGIITFIVVLLIFIYIEYRALQEKQYAIVIGLFVIAFYNLSEFYMTSLFANTFLFFFTYYRYGSEITETTSYPTHSERKRLMHAYEYHGKYIDMKQYIHYLALHWLSLLLAVLITSVTACGITFQKQNAAQTAFHEMYPDGQKDVTLTLTEEETVLAQQYLTDMKLLTTYKTFADTSLYMAIDANNAPHAVITYTASCPGETDTVLATNWIKESINTLQQEIKRDSFFEKWAAQCQITDHTPSMLRDLLTITIANNTQISAEICAPDKEILTTLADSFTTLLTNEVFPLLQTENPQIQFQSEDYYIYTSRDTKIRDAQASILNQVSTYTTKSAADLEKLSDNAKQYLEKYSEHDTVSFGEPITYSKKMSAVYISKKKILLSGLKAGILAAFLVSLFWLISYIATRRIYGRGTLEKTYHIRWLGSFIPEETAERILQRANRHVWKYYCKHAGKHGQTNLELALTLRSLLHLCGEKKLSHLLVFSDVLSSNEQMCHQLQEFLSAKTAAKVTVCSSQELLCAAETEEDYSPENADAILIACVMGCSSFQGMEQLISFSALYDDRFLGYLMIE